MALDVYVGGFARYYAHQWENVAQKWARETGQEYHMVGPHGPPQPADWNEVAEMVTHWRAAMNEALVEHLSQPLDWDETRSAPYFTDRPGYDGYGALLVWAAHAERGTTPPDDYSGEWYSDEAFIECSEPKAGQRYGAILSASLWLPGNFEFSFGFQNLVGEQAHICSNVGLQRALLDLNEKTFGMSQGDLEAGQQGDLDDNPSLSALARSGLSLFHSLARKSVEHHLPIMLDN